MRRYVEQLLEDIKEANRSAHNKLLKIQEEDDDLYIPVTNEDDHGFVLSELLGLEQFIFPKCYYLEDREVSSLVSAMIQLWIKYGLQPHFPEFLPDRMKYGQMRSFLNQKVYPVVGEIVDVELCDYLAGECPLSMHCPLMKYSLDNCNKRALA
ncbi:hypothetical protein DMA11_00645 [Marinilabiliaceae bacterium JC017]|nr:hypothetical protein DMA11_00645 [Marinilabiliaceae bacterium JC017]